ncbi:MAG: hypothetical protein HRU77_06260 [Gammaproteobacteria bacterium]|nr:MAG: hypothetical protein HRU77_06260 [Gammaproteobacteria bacterium]
MVDINKFHGNGEDIRDWLNQPFLLNKRVVATNGHVMLILHDFEWPYYELRVNESYVMIIIDTIESASGYAPIDKEQIAWPEKIWCPICKGGGHATKEECEECQGDGVVDASNNFNTYYDLTCGSCEGIGYETDTRTDQTCPDCEGSGNVFEKDAAVEILGIKIQAKYLSLVIEEPDLQFCAKVDERMLMFKAGENTFGAIMGLRK